jgi:choline-sulfatase
MCVPQKWFDLFPLDQIKLPQARDNDRDDLSAYAISLTNDKHISPTQEWMVSAGEWKHAVQSYLASTAFVDHYVGEVLKALAESPHRDDTIVVLFSDHGFHLGEKQRWAKRTLWEDGTHVPLIVVAPGFAGERKCARPAELLDIYPTLLELAGLPADPAQEGFSLVPLLKDPKADWAHVALTSFGKGNYAVTSEHYRYIRYLDGSEELYDHRKDPNEWDNLAAEEDCADILAEHRRHLPAHEEEVLPGNSTGHAAYAAANGLIRR